MQGYLESAFSLEGQTALITGGGRGIGMAIATSMAKAGANVVIWDIQAELAKETAGRIAKDYGVKAWHFCSDITRKEAIKGDVEKILSMAGNVTILVNNAGVQVRKPALEFTINEWTRVIETHLSATFFISQAIIPHMAANGGGRIINLGSLNCMMAVPNIIAYTAAKSGIAGLTRSMCVEWASLGININAIAPGFVETELTKNLFSNPEKRAWAMGRIPMKRMADPENDLGRVAVFLAAPASSYMNGQIVYVDGGFLAS